MMHVRRRCVMASTVVAAVMFGGFSPSAGADEPTAAGVDRVVVDDSLGGVRSDVVAPNAASAAVVARMLGVPVEDGSATDVVSAEYVLPSGLTRVDQYVGEQFVEDDAAPLGPDRWEVISPFLVADGGWFVPEAYGRELALSGGGDAGVILRAAVGDSGVVVEYVTDFPIPVPRIEGPRAVYEGVVPGVDFVVDVRPSGFEQYFVFHDREAAATPPDLGLRVNGGSARQVESSIEFVDDAGAIVGVMPDAFAWDALNDAKRLEPVLAAWSEDAMVGDGRELPVEEPVMVTATAMGQGVRMHVEVDADWLADPSTVFPVVVDPIVQSVAGSLTSSYPGYTYTGMLDTRVNSAYPSSKYYSDTDLLIGTPDSGNQKIRSFINVSRSKAIGKTINSATLKVFMYHSWSCSARSWNVRATGAVSTATSWSNQPSGFGSTVSLTTTKGFSSSCAGAAVNVNIKTLWQELADKAGTTTTYALRLMATSETDNFSWKRFYSADYATASKRPVLTFTYNRAPAKPTALQVNGIGQTANQGGVDGYPLEIDPAHPNPTLSALVSDPDLSAVTPEFTVQRAPLGTAGSSSAWMLVGSPNGASTASGQRASYTLVGSMLAGYEYRFKVTASDPYTTSPDSVWYYFRLAVAPPPPPSDVQFTGAQPVAGEEGINSIRPSVVTVSGVVGDDVVEHARIRVVVFEDGVPLSGAGQGLGTMVASGGRSSVDVTATLIPGHTYTFAVYANNGYHDSEVVDPGVNFVVVRVDWPSEVPTDCDTATGGVGVGDAACEAWS